MNSEYTSKTGTVSKQPFELYMAFADMRNLLAMLPEDKKQGITADFDSIHGTVQGINMGVKVKNRVPYSRLEFEDDGAPFRFMLTLHFDANPSEPFKTDFHISLSAELNLMLKMALGGKIKGALDKMVDGLVDVSEGRMPEGVDPSQFQGFGNMPS